MSENNEKQANTEFPSCPGSMSRQFNQPTAEAGSNVRRAEPQLRHWPVQLHLVSPFAPFLKDTDLLFCADCVPFTTPNFHEDYLKGKSLIIACPKLDNTEIYLEKLTQMFQVSGIKSITVAIMEVPCCHSLTMLVKQAMENAGAKIPVTEKMVSIKGEAMS